jgi:long-subunit acyl-CoA synthetase (AMP-forming)
VVSQLGEWKIDGIAAAPAFLERVTDVLPQRSLRYVVSGGAPVTPRLCRKVLAVCPGVDGRVLYGSTEAEPIAEAGFGEVASDRGEGLLVGKPVPEADVRLEQGEVWVRGAHVNRRYVNNPEANQKYKVPAPDGTVWHRTGDVGRLDDRGRLWLLGRVGDAFVQAGRTIWPFPVEVALADVTGVRRAAFLDGQIVVEIDDERAMQAVRALLPSIGMEGTPVRAVARIPVDARHNSKIDRSALRRLLA